MSKIICIASGKGGVGKTLVTAALSIALQRQHCSVLAVDADMGLRNLDLMFGVQNSVLYDMGDILKGRCQPQDAVIPLMDGLDFLAASQKRTWEKIDASTFHYTVETLSAKYDYTLIDCPPGRGLPYKAAVSIADRIFFVVEPTWASLRDAGRVMQFCDKHKQFNYDILCNNFFRNDPAYVTVDEMFNVLNPESVAGILPHDNAVQQAVKEGDFIHVDEDNPFFRALGQTVSYITDGINPSVEELLQWLPDSEAETMMSSRHDDDLVPKQENHIKGMAAAELKKAAAILANGPAVEAADETNVTRTGNQENNDEQVVENGKGKGMSLRQRRQQSMAWRHYHR
jgi:septum site-determining protein MinD